jgi:ABC-2 type transport system permease protein
MNRGSVTALVARREISERLQGRLIRIMTAATALLVVAGIVVPGLVKGSSTPTRIGLVGARAQALGPALRRGAEASKQKIRLTEVRDAGRARAQLERGSLEVALSVGADAAHAQVKQSLAPAIAALIAATVDEAHLRAVLSGAGVRPATLQAALAPVRLTTAALHPVPADRSARAIAALAAGLLMYLSLGIYGGAVASGVAQEKTSRTAEVLLAAVRPGQLLGGKVIGIGLTGLGQLGIAAIAGLIANSVVHSTRIPASLWVLLPGFLVCFLAGFVLYAFAFAAAGALVARQEEVQFVTLPIGLPLLVGYLLVYAAISSPNATWLRVLSLLPPLTASLMPARIALGHIAPWELALEVLIMAASIYAMIRFASRVYRGGLISGGSRLGWRTAWRRDPQGSSAQPRRLHSPSGSS